jgi:hypothetical protein
MKYKNNSNEKMVSEKLIRQANIESKEIIKAIAQLESVVKEDVHWGLYNGSPSN